MNEKTRNNLKRLAAFHVFEFIESGMVLGLGSGSTVKFFLEELGKRIRAGKLLQIRGIPSSAETEQIARKTGIPLTNFRDTKVIDLTIDGADEADLSLNLIKGGGGALLREKVLAQNSARFFVIIDETKLTEKLGLNFPLPIEVVPFALEPTLYFLKELGFAPEIRKKASEYFRTDQGNYIIDFFLKQETDVFELAEILSQRAGIAEHGLFLKMADKLIIGTNMGIQIISSV